MPFILEVESLICQLRTDPKKNLLASNHGEDTSGQTSGYLVVDIEILFRWVNSTAKLAKLTFAHPEFKSNLSSVSSSCFLSLKHSN